MATQYRCDRCDRVSDNKPTRAFVPPFKGSGGYKEADLCPSCDKEFSKLNQLFSKDFEAEKKRHNGVLLGLSSRREEAVREWFY